MPETILITGTSGYIASHFAKYFGQKGYAVVGLDKRECPQHIRPFLKEAILADVGDIPVIRKTLEKHGVQLVVHCAAYALVGESVAYPEKYHQNNVVQSGKMLEAMIATGTPSLVFSSTAAVFGNPIQIPITEDHPKAPVNPYGESKLKSEQQFKQAQDEEKIRLGIFRYFNAAGADPEGQLGENHDPETHLIPNALRAALGVQPEFQIFGNDFETRDGTCVRDFIHVNDLALAHYLLAKRMLAGGPGGEYNLGLGEGYTVNETLDVVENVVGKRIPRRYAARRPGDPATLVADASRARQDLGWTPTQSDLPTLVKTAAQWMQKKLA